MYPAGGHGECHAGPPKEADHSHAGVCSGGITCLMLLLLCVYNIHVNN